MIKVMSLSNYEKYENFKEKLRYFVSRYGPPIVMIAGMVMLMKACPPHKKSKLEEKTEEKGSVIINSENKSDFYYTNFNYTEFLNNP